MRIGLKPHPYLVDGHGKRQGDTRSKSFCLNVNPLRAGIFGRKGRQRAGTLWEHLWKGLGNRAAIQAQLICRSIEDVPQEPECM